MSWPSSQATEVSEVKSDMNLYFKKKKILQMTLQAKWMLRRPLMRKPAHCKSTESYLDDRLPFWAQCSRQILTHLWKWFTFPHLQGVHSSLSPFQGSMEAEENSPSASTPASPQTKTASEGELSTTAAELLQDYMTTVWPFHPLSCPILFLRIRRFVKLYSFLFWFFNVFFFPF